MIRLLIVKRKKRNNHVSNDTIEEFEKTIHKSKNNIEIKYRKAITQSLFYIVWRALQRLGFKSNPYRIKILNSNRKINIDPKIRFSILMGPTFQKCFPDFFLSRKNAIYLFDAWPGSHKYITEFVKFFKIDYVFITSSQAVSDLNNLSDRKVYHWIPEGINAEEYKYLEYSQKNIDILSFGRRENKYHKILREGSKIYGYSYLFPEDENIILFKNRDDFINGLSRSRISICFPSNITHPNRAGHIETMTVRYLQSIASKCLVLGHAPNEMIDLFGYNPVIEVDYKNPLKQLLDILNNFNTYIDVIERNFYNLQKEHNWNERWISLEKVINKSFHDNSD